MFQRVNRGNNGIISVRRPVESDANALAEIQIAAWRAAYRGVLSEEYLDAMDRESYAEGWARNIANPKPGIAHLVAQAGNRIVGFCILGPAAGSAESAWGQLYAINVHPRWWANGAGSALFSAAEARLAELGYGNAFLWVEASNERAINFYAKRGWLDDGKTLQDTRFEPPVSQRRHSRELNQHVCSKAHQ